MTRTLAVAAPLLMTLFASTVFAQAKPAFRNGATVDAQGPDGRWYRGRVWKVKKGSPPQYEVKFDGMPANAKRWIPEPKLRAAGKGAVVDVKAIKAIVKAKQLFAQIVGHGKQGKWTNERWNRDLDTLINQFAAQLKAIEKQWPTEPALARLKPLPNKLRANAAQRRKQHGGGAPKATRAGGDTAGLLAFYTRAAKAANDIPASVSANSMASSTQALEGLDLAALEARMKVDAAKHPAVFAYYGMESKGKYADLEYGGKRRPSFSDPNLKRINQYLVPKIYEAKARLLGKDQALADAVQVLMKTAKTVDQALAAVRLGKAVLRCQPKNGAAEGRLGEARKLLASKTQAIAHLIKGPFHVEHMRELVGFTKAQTLGGESAGDVATEITPGKPFYLIGYLSESVKSLGFKKHDSSLGYKTTRMPSVKFRLLGSKQQPFRLPVYSTVTGKGLDQFGAVVIDLMPDPATTYATHLAYLPALHFTRWLLDQPPGQHTIEMSATPALGIDFGNKGAHGRFTVTLTAENKVALKAYYDRLWAKKLSTVVFPDMLGVRDRKGEIPNVDHLEKFGKLLKLTASQRNKVMKPFPNQHQILNYTGAGYGLFEKDGRYQIIPLGFQRKPSEPVLRWTTVGGKPSHYTLQGPTVYEPTVIEFGYEIPKANLAKTGKW